MHCDNCGVDYSPGESCLCAPGNRAASDGHGMPDKNNSVLKYPGETDAFCSLSLDPGRGGVP